MLNIIKFMAAPGLMSLSTSIYTGGLRVAERVHNRDGIYQLDLVELSISVLKSKVTGCFCLV